MIIINPVIQHDHVFHLVKVVPPEVDLIVTETKAVVIFHFVLFLIYGGVIKYAVVLYECVV